MPRRTRILILVVVLAPVAFVARQAISTLRALTEIERERDTWQRPDDILRPDASAPAGVSLDRATRQGQSDLAVIHGKDADPRLPQGPVDAALIADTYHELASPESILRALAVAMRPGARLVVVDRGPRGGHEAGAEAASSTARLTTLASGGSPCSRSPRRLPPSRSSSSNRADRG